MAVRSQLFARTPAIGDIGLTRWAEGAAVLRRYRWVVSGSRKTGLESDGVRPAARLALGG